MRFQAPDLSQLPAPQLIETISADAIIAEIKAWIIARWAQVRVDRPDLPALDTLGLETEPLTILIESVAYRETLLRALVNDKARAVLLAYARGTDLDHLGARLGVSRLAGEVDDRFRRRIQLAPEAFSVAGPKGAYEFHALSKTLDIMDAYAFSPSPEAGRVLVVLAGPNGADVSNALMGDVLTTLRAEDVVPLTDIVQVTRAARVSYAVTAELVVASGPDPGTIALSAEAAIRAYTAAQCRIGEAVYRSGLFAAAKVGGVRNVILSSPAADVVCDQTQIPVLSGVSLTTTVV